MPVNAPRVRSLHLAAWVAVLSSSCSSTHGTPDAWDQRVDGRVITDTSGPLSFPSIEGDRRLVDINLDEWGALCDWRSTVRPVPPDYYYCTQDGEYCGEDDRGGTCGPVHDWTVEVCLESEAGYWLGGRACATATVEQWERCVRDEAAVVCFTSVGMFPDSCEVVYCEAP